MFQVLSLLMETTSPEAPTSAHGPASHRRRCPSSGSPVPPNLKSPKIGHTTVGDGSECELHVVPATEFKSGARIYPMRRSSRGKCLIFNNYDFGGLAPKREGSEHDVRRMKDLFKALHFECIEHIDLPAS
ncbi:hypothetical protein MTO96_037932, partial [Rhipicephalus appendiculatus]